MDIILGDNVRYNFDYFIDKGFYWSVGVRSQYNQFLESVPALLLLSPEEVSASGINIIETEYDDITNQLYFQTLFRKDFVLTLGAEHKNLRIESETILENIDDESRFFEKSNFLSVFGSLKLDTYDNAYFPKTGFYFNGEFKLYLYSSDFTNSFSEFSITKADIGYVKSFNKLSVKLNTQGGFKIGEDENKLVKFCIRWLWKHIYK